jgi:hypothetical protein
MTPPKVETVNVVTMEHGRQFLETWFDGGDINEACFKTGILTWHGEDEYGRASALEDDILRRFFEAVKEHMIETFVRVANAAIDAERLFDDTKLVPPRVETVPVVTVEHGEAFTDDAHRHMIDSGGFVEAFCQTHVMKWPDDDEPAQAHFNEMADEIRDRIHEETRPVIVEAFVRIASDVTLRERRRRS